MDCSADKCYGSDTIHTPVPTVIYTALPTELSPHPNVLYSVSIQTTNNGQWVVFNIIAWHNIRLKTDAYTLPGY